MRFNGQRWQPPNKHLPRDRYFLTFPLCRDDTTSNGATRASFLRRVRTPDPVLPVSLVSIDPGPNSVRCVSERIAQGRPLIQSRSSPCPASARSFAFESLESRELLAADISIQGDVLNIRGTSRSDVIFVERLTSGPDSGLIQVTLNGQQKQFDDNYTGAGNGTISRIVINARGGSDQITFASNIDIPATIAGGRGSDTIVGGAGNNIIDGGRGNDTILGNDGDDSIIGGRGHDHIQAGGGNDIIFGGRGNDMLNGGEGKDTLHGDTGNDEIYGDKGQDELFGGRGHDRIFGGSQDDFIDGGAGNDELYGEAGTDVIFGQLGNDRLDGGDNDDHLDGGLGNDDIFGGNGDDQLKGGAGVDTLDGQAGFNLLHNEPNTEVLLNGVVVDLDREFYLNFANSGPNSFAKFDIKNINGQAVEKLTVQCTA